MFTERTRHLRPELELPTTAAWYLASLAAAEGRDVAEVASRLLTDALVERMRHLSTRERWMLDHSIPDWQRYQGEPYQEPIGPKAANGRADSA